MIIHNVQQGSKEWHDLRATCFTASEAPAMMGASKYVSRSQLIHEKKTGNTKPVSAAQQALFDRGHFAEAAIRPVIDALINDELFPATATSEEHSNLLASFDGVTMMEDIIFEHKLWNETLAENVRNGVLEPHYYWQLEQQLLVSGAEKAIFVTSDGTQDKMVWMEYFPVEGRAQALLDGWEQFAKDLAAYAPEAKVEKVAAEVVADLPALVVKVAGQVSSSNLDQYKGSALAFIGSISTDLQNDHDFAIAEKTIKCCEKAEKELEQAKQEALSQTADISKLFETIDEIKESMRQKRLELNRLVKSRKEEIKKNILSDAATELNNHVAEVNMRIEKVLLPPVAADFAGAIKGKRNLQSMKDAVADEIAKAKIEVNKTAVAVQDNLDALDKEAEGFEFLFADLQQVVFKEHGDFINLVKARIIGHQHAEAEKANAEDTQRAQETETCSHELSCGSELPSVYAQEPLAKRQENCVTTQTAPGTRTKEEIDISCWLFDNIMISQSHAEMIAEALISGKVPHIGAIKTAKAA